MRPSKDRFVDVSARRHKYAIDIGLTLCKYEAVLTKKELLILERLVADGPLYGLQLVDRSGGALKRGTVYVTLGRMESKGIVESEQEPPVPGAIGMPRRIYRPTALGERMLRAWTTFTREMALEVNP
jgi:DNA-binding PadR family transcriptional regulator